MSRKLIFNPATDNLEYIETAISTNGNVVVENIPCDENVQVKDWLYISGSTAKKAIATNVSTSNVIGICDEKVTSTSCNIRVQGTTEEIFTGLDVSANYYLSPDVAGAMTTTPPSQAGQVLVTLGKPLSAVRFVVLIGLRLIRG